MRFIIILFILLASCGTSKKAVKVSTLKKDVVISKQNDITVNTNIHKTATTTTYSPINPNMPMILPDGRTSTNTVIEEKSEVKENLTTQIDKSVSEEAETIKEKNKDIQVETKKPNPWLWGSVAVVICFALYFAKRWFGVFTKK